MEELPKSGKKLPETVNIINSLESYSSLGETTHENGRNHPALRLKPPVSVSFSSDSPNVGHEPRGKQDMVMTATP